MFKKTGKTGSPKPKFNKFGKNNDKKREGRDGREGRGGAGSRFFQKKVCRFCADRITVIDFKDAEKLRKFLTEKGKIMPRRITGNCAKCQRALTRAIKRSRHAALVAFQID